MRGTRHWYPRKCPGPARPRAPLPRVGGRAAGHVVSGPPSIPRETSAPLRQLLLALLQRNHKDRMDFGERPPASPQRVPTPDGPPGRGAASWPHAPRSQLPGAHSTFPAAQAVETPVLQWEVPPLGKPMRRGGGASARGGEEPPAGAVSLHAWRGAGRGGRQGLLELRPQRQLGGRDAVFPPGSPGVRALLRPLPSFLPQTSSSGTLSSMPAPL